MSHVARFSTPCGRYYVCPYNRSHEVKWTRAVNHLMKCEQQNAHMNLIVCPSNALHRMAKSEMDSHLKMCPDYLGMLTYMYEETNRTVIADSVRVPRNNIAAGGPTVWQGNDNSIDDDDSTAEAKESHPDKDDDSAIMNKQELCLATRTDEKQGERTTAKPSAAMHSKMRVILNERLPRHIFIPRSSQKMDTAVSVSVKPGNSAGSK